VIHDHLYDWLAPNEVTAPWHHYPYPVSGKITKTTETCSHAIRCIDEYSGSEINDLSER